MRVKSLAFGFFLFSLLSYSFGACNQPANLTEALTCLCTALYEYVSIVAFMMIVLSSIVYALGQLFGAETRARANVWATSMLTGAIIGVILIVIVPGFLASVLGVSFNPNTCTVT